MTRVLVVDDEIIFRNNIRGLLDWNANDFEICGEAGDGVSAKREIEVQRPDIVITDMKMPGVDGLSLITFLHENHPDIQIIALSGYDDYEYVRTSMKFGVVDYLLKHSIIDVSLLSTLHAASKRIHRANESRLDSERIRKQIDSGLKVIRQRFLMELLEGHRTNVDEICRQARELSLPIGSGMMMVVVAEIDGLSVLKSHNTQGEWQALCERMLELIGDNLPEEAMLVSRPGSGFVLLFSMRDTYSEHTFFSSVSGCISQIRTALKRHYNATACYSISGQIPSPEHLKQAYEKARKSLGQRIYRESDIVIHDSSIPKAAHRNYDIDFHDEQNIMQLLKSSSRQGVEEYIKDIFRNIRDCGLDSLRVQLIFANLTNLLSRALREYGADLMTVCPDFYSVYQNLQHMTLNKMQQGVLECYISTMQYLERYGEMKKYHEVTRQAIIYINRNYIRDISLNTIAEHAHISASYLSRIFKEDTGSCVVEFLNRIRVEHAKQLIREGVKLNKLSHYSGFNSDTYFYTVFKNNTGKTPREYKEELIQAAT